MKKLALLIIILNVLHSSYGQDLDLLVLKAGDSIACKIDSLNEKELFFAMINRGSWIQTSTPINSILEYHENCLNRNHVIFKTGTSYILSVDSTDIKNTSTDEIRKNALYFEFAGTGIFWTLISYDRIIPLTEKIAIVPRLGFTYFDDIIPVYELNFVAGGPHYLETGIGQYGFFTQRDYMIRLGYRYHGKKGFVFRAAPQFFHEYMDGTDKQNRFWFGLSLGYCFH